MATYYEQNKDERLEYQRFYNTINNNKYIEYQKWYYQNVLKHKRVNTPKIRVKKEVIKKTKITKGFLKVLEKVCKQKIRDYYDTLEAEQEALELSIGPKPFEGFNIKNGMFSLSFN